MAGNKNSGRGRKTNANEEFRMQTIEECWRLVRENINNPELPLQFRIELAAKHTVKSIPTEMAGGFTAEVTTMGTIELVNEGVSSTLRFNIGSQQDDQVDPPQNS